MLVYRVYSAKEAKLWQKKDNMLFTLSTDPEFSLLTEQTESRRLRLDDSWAPKPCFSFPSKTFQEPVDLPFVMTSQGQDIVTFSCVNLRKSPAGVSDKHD